MVPKILFVVGFKCSHQAKNYIPLGNMSIFFFFVELEIPEFTIESLGYLMFVSYVRLRT